MTDGSELNHRELERYVRRIADRWPVQRALLGGARVATSVAHPLSGSAVPST